MAVTDSEILYGLDDEDRCKVLQELLVKVYKAIMYEKDKDVGQALNNGMTLIEKAMPNIQDCL